MDESNPLSPVFVDATGRRRRRMRRVGYLFGTASLVYTGLVGAGFSGGPIDPHALLPLPDLLDRPEAAPSTPTPAKTASPRPEPEAAADTRVAVDQAVPVQTRSPLPASSPAAQAVLTTLAGAGPAVGPALEHGVAQPAPADAPLSPEAEPAEPVDETVPAEPAEPAGSTSETAAPRSEPSPDPAPTESPAAGADNAAAASETPESSQSTAREGRRPSPRPVASR
ncbi:hypothetical protein [Phytohabitans houttuyneae]|uniref:Uncharacterized protein n=1 Tax=Phytohabitans houttuyneae TaxID=1076126 RepID=A0A6V8K9B4_9ACTN|nr:hypothetical protein [Phytohabitans houttuyneae]GFJ81792.1 hypothetical protein Phou_059720 [Phytohabitans houttuyneae]